MFHDILQEVFCYLLIILDDNNKNLHFVIQVLIYISIYNLTCKKNTYKNQQIICSNGQFGVPMYDYASITKNCLFIQ